MIQLLQKFNMDPRLVGGVLEFFVLLMLCELQKEGAGENHPFQLSHWNLFELLELLSAKFVDPSIALQYINFEFLL